jgi:type II secretion system protein G
MAPDKKIPKHYSPVNHASSRVGCELVIGLSIFLLIFAARVLMQISSGRANWNAYEKLARATADINNLQTALSAFAADTGTYPHTTQGLQALIQNPGLPTWKGPYIKRINADPWGKPYRYTPSILPGKPYTLSSDGPDALPNTPDDIKKP